MERSKIVEQSYLVGVMSANAGDTMELIGDLMANVVSDESDSLLSAEDRDYLSEHLNKASDYMAGIVKWLNRRKKLIHKTYHQSIDQVFAEPEELMQLDFDDETQQDTPPPDKQIRTR